MCHRQVHWLLACTPTLQTDTGSRVAAEPWYNTAHVCSGMVTCFPQSLFQLMCPVITTTCPLMQGTSSLTILPLLLNLTRIFTQTLANAAPLAHSKGGLIENLLNYLAGKRWNDTSRRQPGSLAWTQQFSPTPGSACQILPPFSSPQNPGSDIKAWQTGSTRASLPPPPSLPP